MAALDRSAAALNGSGGDMRSPLEESHQLMDKRKLTPAAAMRLYGNKLTAFECREIFRYKEIYFTGPLAKKVDQGCDEDKAWDHQPTPPPLSSNKPGAAATAANSDSFIAVAHDHIAYRYEILKVVGQGSFGTVLKCFDHKSGGTLAIKIIRNERRVTRQAMEEIRNLNHLMAQDPRDTHCIVRFYGSFAFRGHLCLCFELLSMSLFDLMHRYKYAGFNATLVKKIGASILQCLAYLRSQRIIHCDLKPENILLCSYGRSAIKVIDFGSSCRENQAHYTYIQSRYYRAPEVMLCCGYSYPIDMWSFACILVELSVGHPAFPGRDEAHQMALYMELLGLPPKSLLDRGQRSHIYFNSHDQPWYCMPAAAAAAALRHSGGTGMGSAVPDCGPPGTRPWRDILHPRRYNNNGALSSTAITTLSSPNTSSTNSATTNNNTTKSTTSDDWMQSSSRHHQDGLLHLLQGCLQWDPELRWGPEGALQSVWFTDTPILPPPPEFKDDPSPPPPLLEQHNKQLTSSQLSLPIALGNNHHGRGECPASGAAVHAPPLLSSSLSGSQHHLHAGGSLHHFPLAPAPAPPPPPTQHHYQLHPHKLFSGGRNGKSSQLFAYRSTVSSSSISLDVNPPPVAPHHHHHHHHHSLQNGDSWQTGSSGGSQMNLHQSHHYSSVRPPHNLPSVKPPRVLSESSYSLSSAVENQERLMTEEMAGISFASKVTLTPMKTAYSTKSIHPSTEAADRAYIESHRFPPSKRIYATRKEEVILTGRSNGTTPNAYA